MKSLKPNFSSAQNMKREYNKLFKKASVESLPEAADLIHRSLTQLESIGFNHEAQMLDKLLMKISGADEAPTNIATASESNKLVEMLEAARSNPELSKKLNSLLNDFDRTTFLDKELGSDESSDIDISDADDDPSYEASSDSEDESFEDEKDS